jgi:hypothetical protein
MVFAIGMSAILTGAQPVPALMRATAPYLQRQLHIIPNHAHIHLGLLYGDDFQKGLMITNTTGWDTDCRSGNIGCLMRIKNGMAGQRVSRPPEAVDMQSYPLLASASLQAGKWCGRWLWPIAPTLHIHHEGLRG